MKAPPNFTITSTTIVSRQPSECLCVAQHPMAAVLKNWALNVAIGLGVIVLFPLLCVAELWVRWTKKPSTWETVKGKKVVITGASSGIGQHLAEALASEGAHLVICARRLTEVQAVAEKCIKLGASSATAFEVDVSNEEQCKQFAKRASELCDGQIDAIVLNAGISMAEFFNKLDNCQVIKQIMDVNFLGCAYGTLYFLPMLTRSSQARIMVVSSLIGVQGCPTRTGYAASKFALKGFYESLACELPSNVTTTMVYPGVIKTDINRTRFGSLNLKTEDGMSATDAVNIMKQALQEGHKEVYFPAVQGYVLYHLRYYFPELVKAIMTRRFLKMHQHK
eukprot:TRINITY_DN4706_c0_g1_i1.p2 TRINITY_DN4706_c0_g1~~TRINITY_DN4706_c0_g1_i1.p2  ORF type:complete len:336 (-),score=76.92 TRINITY_DN4706_c0_g1_i1:91-1098(-)